MERKMMAGRQALTDPGRSDRLVLLRTRPGNRSEKIRAKGEFFDAERP